MPASRRLALPALLVTGVAIVVFMTSGIRVAGSLLGGSEVTAPTDGIGNSSQPKTGDIQDPAAMQGGSDASLADDGGLYGEEGIQEMDENGMASSMPDDGQVSGEQTPTIPPRLPPAGLVCNARVRKIPVTPNVAGPYFFYEYTAEGNTAAAAEKNSKDSLAIRAQAKCAQKINEPSACTTGCTDGGVTAVFTPFKNNAYVATNPTGLKNDGKTYQATFQLRGQCVTTRSCTVPAGGSGR